MNFELNNFARKCLMSQSCISEVQILREKFPIDDIKNSIFNITFDCTQNWWINWTKKADNSKKQNWYFLDNFRKKLLAERVNNINLTSLSNIVKEIVNNVIGPKKVLWFSIYWSYLYWNDRIPIWDLDLLIIIEGANNLAIDAMLYPIDNMPDLFKSNKRLPQSDNIWYSVVSRDSLTTENNSYIITDSALLDVSTTYSFWEMINADKLPPFVIIENAKKILKWWASLLLSSQNSAINRIYETLKMREFVLLEFNDIPFKKVNYKIDFTRYLDNHELLDLIYELLNILDEDIRTIKEYIILKLKLWT